MPSIPPSTTTDADGRPEASGGGSDGTPRMADAPWTGDALRTADAPLTVADGAITTRDVAAEAKLAVQEDVQESVRGDAQEKAREEAKPIQELRPTLPQGLGSQIVELARYMAATEVHTYAFSVAANVILSLFPFIILLLTLSRRVFHSRVMEGMVGDIMRSFLPVSPDFIVSQMQMLAHPHKRTQVFSLVLLLITSTSVFLPLEVALNKFGLAIAVGALAMASAALTAGHTAVVTWIFFGHTDNLAYHFFALGFFRIVAVLLGILLFFLIYWVLPNRPIPARSVLPTAIVVGVLWELGKQLYILALPLFDFESVYGRFQTSVGLMTWAFFSGLLLLGGARFSATRHTLMLARQAEAEAVQARKFEIQAEAEEGQAKAMAAQSEEKA
jgi:membrane protein